MVGQFSYNLDSKLRLFIPSKYRDEVGKDFVIVRDLRHKCLRGFSAAGFLAFNERLLAIPQPDRDKLIRFYTRICVEGAADAQGRMQLNKDLLAYAQFDLNDANDRETKVVGCIDHFEIWKASVYQSEVVDKEDIAALIANADAFGI